MSLNNKLLWVKTPKCAGTSMRVVIKNSLAKGRPRGGIYTLKNNLELGVITFGNIEGFRKTHPDFYNSSYKFALIRNPYDRVVSSYCYVVKKRWYSGSFREFLMTPFEDLSPSTQNHTISLTMHLSDNTPDGLDYLDELVKIENLSENINNLFKKFKIPNVNFPRRNATKHKHYTEYYDDETRELVAEKYKKDIEYFGYEFGE